MHGLWLAASNALKALHTIQDAKISIEAVYLGCDALSQVVGLSRPPQILKPKLRRLYANINLHLLELTNLTGQKKEDNKRINQIKNHQAPSQSITLFATKAMCQHTKFKEQHTTIPAYKDSLTEISIKDLPTV